MRLSNDVVDARKLVSLCVNKVECFLEYDQPGVVAFRHNRTV